MVVPSGSTPRTLLEQLVHGGDRTVEEHCADFLQLADKMGERSASLSVRQLGRWMAGGVVNARPASRRVARELWGHDFKRLLQRPDADAPAEGRGGVALPQSAKPTQSQPRSGDSGAGGVDGHADIGLDLTGFLSGIDVETPVPMSIGWTEVEHVRATTSAIASAENSFGGGLACETAMAQLRWVAKLLSPRSDDGVRRALVEAVGNLGSVVAHSAFDIAAYEAADRCYKFSLWCADESGSWALRANTLAEMSRMSAYLGDLDEALSLIEFAQVRADRVSATARAMMWTLRARYLASCQRFAEAEDDVRRASDCFAESDHAGDPPWLIYYDTAEHRGSTGKALLSIARARKDLDVAAPLLGEAIALQGSDYPRSRAFSRIRLATLIMDVGDPRDAVPVGRQALVEAASLRSQRILRELGGLASVSRRHQIGDVADLRADIQRAAIVGASGRSIEE